MKVQECIKPIVIGALVVFFLTYLTFAFVKANLNPFDWEMADRVCFAIIFWGLLATWSFSICIEMN